MRIPAPLRFIAREGFSWWISVKAHRRRHGEARLFLFPRTFSELTVRKKLLDHKAIVQLTADKAAVRAYVSERIGPQYLIPLITITADPGALDFAALPRAFIAKATHGSGMTLIVHDKAALDIPEARATMKRWLAENYFYTCREPGYLRIPPQVIIEELLLVDGAPPPDFKFFVFRGKVRMVQVDSDRFTGHTRDLFDEAWRHLNVRYEFPHAPVAPSRPDNLDEMIRVAERLADGFVSVRVDLYSVNGRIYFGEITHSPGGGLERFDPPEFDRALGSVWKFGSSIPEAFFTLNSA